MNEKKTILIVDDEQNILELLKYNIEKSGLCVIEAKTGKEALYHADNTKVDAIVLDLMLPDISGLEVLQRIKQNNVKLPVMLLTAKGEEIDRVIGLELGADEYLPKPFSIREFLARLRAIMRRFDNLEISEEETTKNIVFGNITISEESRTVFKSEKEIELTLKEYELLRLLAKNINRVFTRDELLEAVWGYDYIGETRTIDVHISQLRKKIESDDSAPKYIKTVRGIGYKLSGDKRL